MLFSAGRRLTTSVSTVERLTTIALERNRRQCLVAVAPVLDDSRIGLTRPRRRAGPARRRDQSVVISHQCR
jgi:hypothetical protein